jgi:hypothetical protein
MDPNQVAGLMVRFLDGAVEYEPEQQAALFEPDAPTRWTEKLDLLERLLEVTRGVTGYHKNRLDMRSLDGLHVAGTGMELLVKADAQRGLEVAEPYRALDYQLPLMQFLLINSSAGRLSVLRTIEALVSSVHTLLGPADYEKTRIGTTRCYTNARFAATTLRRYGFLQYTYREAYKCWELSFLGILVAAITYEDAGLMFGRVPPGETKQRYFPLHPKVGEALERLQSPKAVAAVIRELCQASGEAFSDFGTVVSAVTAATTNLRGVLAGPGKMASRSKNPRRAEKLRADAARRLVYKLGQLADVKRFRSQMAVELQLRPLWGKENVGAAQ